VKTGSVPLVVRLSSVEPRTGRRTEQRMREITTDTEHPHLFIINQHHHHHHHHQPFVYTPSPLASLISSPALSPSSFLPCVHFCCPFLCPSDPLPCVTRPLSPLSSSVVHLSSARLNPPPPSLSLTRLPSLLSLLSLFLVFCFLSPLSTVCPLPSSRLSYRPWLCPCGVDCDGG
jgi:hypothetical protein